MTWATSHNGGRSQLNLWFFGQAGAYETLNLLKGGSRWTKIVTGGGPDPSTLNSNGYPISLPEGLSSTFQKPSPAARPGNYVCDWVGEMTMDFNSNNTLVSGGKSGVNGRYVFSTTASSMEFRVTAINASNPPAQIRIYHVDDEDSLNNGGIWGVKFLERLRAGNFGVIRFLDFQYANTTNVAKWAHRRPVGYIHYQGTEFRSDYWGGETTNSGNDYSLAYAPSIVPADKELVIVRFNATATNECTLNGISIKRSDGGNLTEFDTNGLPRANSYGTLVYDAELNFWLKFGGDLLSFSTGIDNGVPIELCLDLASTLGAHPWIVQPPLSADPVSDWIGSCAQYLKLNKPSWMMPKIEPCGNEQWNAGFFVNGYSSRKANARGWGTGFQNQYGRCVSQNGQAVSAIFGDDRTQYDVVACVQTSTSATASNSDPRLTCPLHVAAGGDPATDWVTAIGIANYWGRFATAADDLTSELGYAFQYSTADAPTRATILEAYIQNNSIQISGSASGPDLSTRMDSWKAWGDSHGITKRMFYEGGKSMDAPSSNTTASITGITNAANGVITLASGSAMPPVGSTVSVAGTGGSTGINGQSTTVVSYDSVTRKVTVSRDTTSDGTYTSGGTMTFTNSASLRATLRLAAKRTPSIYNIAVENLQDCINRGFIFPSLYMLSGAAQTWSTFDPTVYDDPTPDWQAYGEFNEQEETAITVSQQIINQPAGAPTIRRRRVQYDNYDTIAQREKIREIEALKAAILARGETAPLAAKVREFIPYRPTMNIITLVAELARVQQELEDEEDMIVLALLH